MDEILSPISEPASFEFTPQQPTISNFELSLTPKTQRDETRQQNSEGAVIVQKANLLDTIRQAKKNLCYELEYISNVIDTQDLKGSPQFELYQHSVMTDQLLSNQNFLGGNSEEDENETNILLKSMSNFQKLDKGDHQQLKGFLRKMLMFLNRAKQEVLKDVPDQENYNEEMDNIEHQLTQIGCYLERVRLYLDNHIYPRDTNLNLMDINIEGNENKDGRPSLDRPRQFSERRRVHTYKDFISAYSSCKKINEKIKKMEAKDMEILSQESVKLSRASQGVVSIDLDEPSFQFEKLGFVSKQQKEMEELKKQIQNNNVTKKDLFFSIVQKFSSSLANKEDCKEVLNKEVVLQVLTTECNIGNNEVYWTLYQENNVAFSEPYIISPCKFNDSGYSNVIFLNIPMRTLMANNLVLIIKVIETQTSKHPSNTQAIMGTSEEYSQLKLYKGYSILPLTKLFWQGQLKNGSSTTMEQAKFYRPSESFKIEQKYTQLIEKKGLKKYYNSQLTGSINLNYSFFISSRFNKEKESNENTTFIQKANFDNEETFHKDKEVKIRDKQEYRFNDLKIDLRELLLNDQFIKRSPALRIEVALRDNYGTVYDTVYITKCGSELIFGQTYESQIYITCQQVAIYESFQIRIPTKSMETLRELYLIFIVQTLAYTKDSKGYRINKTNIQNELANLQFQAEQFGVFSLYDSHQNSIKRNDEHILKMHTIDKDKFMKTKKIEKLKAFPLAEDKLSIKVTIISNEFTNNQFINQLMQIDDSQLAQASVLEQILSQLKSIDSDELVAFHDKILDKLFQILTFSKSPRTQDIIFETIIQIIELFHNDYKDYKDLLTRYIQNHYAPQKAYIPLLHQLRQTSEIVKQGFKAENELQNEECLLDTMKYLGIILTLIRNSYIEEQQCMTYLQQTSDNAIESGNLKLYRDVGSIELPQNRIGGIGGIIGNKQHAFAMKNLQIGENLGHGGFNIDTYLKMKQSNTIEEEEDDEEQDFFVRNNVAVGLKDQLPSSQNNSQNFTNHHQQQTTPYEKHEGSQFSKQMPIQQYDLVKSKSIFRKRQIRKTIQVEGILNRTHFSKLDFTITLQKSILSIFEGCHKDSSKPTVSLRAILYENIVDALEQMIDYMDDRFFNQLMLYFYQQESTQTNVSPNRGSSRSTHLNSLIKAKGQSYSHQNELSMTSLMRKNSIAASATFMSSYRAGNRQSELIEDYVTTKNFLEGLKDLNFINEEHIVKLQIIAMGQILSSSILFKIKGNTNRVVQGFCDYVEHAFLRRIELSTHLFYFLNCLFKYLAKKHEISQNEETQSNNNNNEFKEKPSSSTSNVTQNIRKNSSTNTPSQVKGTIGAALKNQALNLGPFFMKILPEITAYLRLFFKESNAQLRIKESTLFEQTLSPFHEQTSLVCLSVMNSLSSEHLKAIIVTDAPRILLMMKNLRKLVKLINFREPYGVFFEKKKIQVFRKVNSIVMYTIMEQNNQQFGKDLQGVIVESRIMHIQLLVMILKQKLTYKKTMRSKSMVKDELGLSKGDMLDLIRRFRQKYDYIGKQWQYLNQMKTIVTQASELIREGCVRTLNFYMELLSRISELEYKATQSVQNSSNCLFLVFNYVNQDNSSQNISQSYVQCFQSYIEKRDLYIEDKQFQKTASNIAEQMNKLRLIMQNVNESKIAAKTNIFYQSYCQSKLMELFWELKLFKLFSNNRETFKSLQRKMEDYSEMASTDLRFLEIIQQSEESQLYIGQREITALIQLDLMKEIVENLQKANLYEKAVQIMNQMKDLYENVLFDYEAVGRILKQQAKVYKQMSENKDRHYASYFKIGFFGQTFPAMLRDQYFIYRGTKLAKRLDIFNEIKKSFNDILMINDSNRPKLNITEGNQKYIQITAVSPLTFRELKDFGLAPNSKDTEELELAKKVKYLPENLKIYYLENCKNKFYQETVIHSKVGDELQHDIQIEIFKVKDKFPSLFKMQLIHKPAKKIQLNAIDKAIRTVSGLNERLQQQKSDVANQIYEQGNLNQLGGYIQGTLDSPIQGGIQRFINVFVNEEYLRSNQKMKVLELVQKIQEHTEILSDAIQLFSQNSEDDRLMTKFQGDFQKFKENIDEVRAFVDEMINDNDMMAIEENSQNGLDTSQNKPASNSQNNIAIEGNHKSNYRGTSINDSLGVIAYELDDI